MIGSVAPNHGVSPATSNELQKPADHAQTKGPHKVRFVELCSCLGSFTSKLTKLGANLLGFAEPSQEPVDLFKHKFPSARATDDLYDLTSFKAWITDFGEVDLLVLGPSCKSFSAAGKQDWSNPRARHAPDSADVAALLRPLIVTMEITKELQTNDESHGLYSLTMKKYKEAGYVLASAELVRDSEIGGCQSRHRLIITWDRSDVHDMIPQIPSLNSLHKPPCPLKFALVPLPNIPDHVWLKGKFKLNGNNNHTPAIYPTRVGTLTWGGPQVQVRPGSIVRHITTGDFWRVTSTKNDGQLYVVTTPDDPRNPQCSEFSSDEVTHHAQTVTVHSIDGVAVPIKTWGEGLEGQSMLILDTRKAHDAVRPLLPLECWLIQGKPMSDWQYLRNTLNVSARRCAQLCGEGIPTSLASAVSQRAFSRVQQCKQRLAKREHNPVHSKQPRKPPRDRSPDSDSRKRKQPPHHSDASTIKRTVSIGKTQSKTMSLIQPTRSVPVASVTTCMEHTTVSNDTKTDADIRSYALPTVSDTLTPVVDPADATGIKVTPSRRAVELQPLQQEPTVEKAVLIALDNTSDNLSSVLLHQGRHTWWYELPLDMKPANARGAAHKAMYDKVKQAWPFESTESLSYAITTKAGGTNLHIIALLGSKPPPEWYTTLNSSLPTNSWLDEAILASRAKLVSFGYSMDENQAPTVQALHKAGNISFTKLYSNKLKIDELHQVGAIPESSEKLLADFTSQQRYLKKTLLQVDPKDPDADMLHAWAAQIPNNPHPEIQQFCQSCKYCPLPFSNKLALTPFSPAYEAPTTEWLCRQPQTKQVPPHFKPSSIEDLLLPQGLSLLRKLQRQALENHQLLKKGHRIHHPADEAIVIGEDMIRPEARGIVWDLRPVKNKDGEPVSSARPLDLLAPMSTHLNTKLLRAELKDFPDQEVLSMLLEGAQLKADIPSQIAILPHLSSLSYGYESVQEELLKMHDRGWYEFHRDIPFCPWRALPQGSTSRKYEPDRHRRTTDGGAPRHIIRDNGGTEVTPINVACHGGEGVTPIKKSPYWPKEWKPSLLQLMHDINIILYAAINVFKEFVYSGTDDVFSFFNQIKLAPSEIWKTGLHWCNLTQDPAPWGTFVVEKVLGFGLSPNSNIAQRFANAIVYMFCNRFDLIEEPMLSQEKNPAIRSWIEARRSLGPTQCRLYIIKMYTDDVKFVVVGTQRLIRFLRCWDNLMKELGLIMAIAKKRQLGCASSWLGFLPCPMMALVAIPREKVSTAITGLSTLAEGSPLRMDAYRSLLGFLEHLIPFDNSGRASMFGFYNVFRGGDEMSPSALIKPNAMVRSQSQRKINILTRHPFVSTLQLALKDASNLLQTQIPSVAFVYTDAAKDDCINPSIAGYLYGRWWSIPVNEKMHRLPIAALEFLAIAISFVIFHKLLKHYSAIVFSTDSQVSAMVMASDNARSTTTQNLQLLLRSLSEYKDLSMRTYVSTVHGVGNVMGDGFSRSKHKAMKAVAAELGVRISRQKISSRAYAIANMNFEDPDLMIGLASDDNACCGVQILGEVFEMDLGHAIKEWKDHLRQHLSQPVLPSRQHPGHDFRSESWRHSTLTQQLQTAYSVFSEINGSALQSGPPDLSRPQQLLNHIEQIADHHSTMPITRSLMIQLYYAFVKTHKPLKVMISVEHHTASGTMLSSSILYPEQRDCVSGPNGMKIAPSNPRAHLVLANCHWQYYDQYCAEKTIRGLQVPASYDCPVEAIGTEEHHEVLEGPWISKPPPDQQHTRTIVSDNGMQVLAAVLDLPLSKVQATWTTKLHAILFQEPRDDTTLSLLKQSYQPTQLHSAKPDSAPKSYLNLNNHKQLATYILTLAEAGCFVLSMQLMEIAYRHLSTNRWAPYLILSTSDEEGHITFAASEVSLDTLEAIKPRFHLSCFVILHNGHWMFLSNFCLMHRCSFSLDIPSAPMSDHPVINDSAMPTDSPTEIGKTIRMMASWFLHHQEPPLQQLSVMCGVQGVARLLNYTDTQVATLYCDLLQRSSAILDCYPHLAVSLLDAWSVMLLVRSQALLQQQPHTPWLSQWVMAVDTASSEKDRIFLQDSLHAPFPSTTFTQQTAVQQIELVAEVANKLKMCLAQGVAPLSPPLLRALLLYIASVEHYPPLRIKHIKFQPRADSSQQQAGQHSCCGQLQISQETILEHSTTLKEVGTLTLLDNHWSVHTPSNRFYHPIYDEYDMLYEPIGDTKWLGMGQPIPNGMLPPNQPVSWSDPDYGSFALVPRNPELPTTDAMQDCGARILALCFLLERAQLTEEWISLIDEAFSPPEEDLVAMLQRTHLTMQARPPLPVYTQDLLYAAFEAYHRCIQGHHHTDDLANQASWCAPQGEGWEAYYKRMARCGIIPLSPALMDIFYDRLQSRWNGSGLEILWMENSRNGTYQLLSKSPSTPHPFPTESMYAMLLNNHWIHGPSVALAQLAAIGNIQRAQDLLESAFIVGMGDHILSTPRPDMWMYCQDLSEDSLYNTLDPSIPSSAIQIAHHCGVNILAQAFRCDGLVVFDEYRSLVNDAFSLDPNWCPLVPWQLLPITPIPQEEQHANSLQQLLYAAFAGYNVFLESSPRIPLWARELATSVMTTTDPEVRHALYNIAAARGIMPLSFSLMVLLYRRLSSHRTGRPLVMQWFHPSGDNIVSYLVLDKHTAQLPYGDQIAEPWDNRTRSREDPLHIFLFHNHFRLGLHHFHHHPGDQGHALMPLPSGVTGEYDFIHTFELADLAYLVGMDDNTSNPPNDPPPLSTSRLPSPTEPQPVVAVISQASQTNQACGLLLLAQLARVTYTTAHETWCNLIRSMHPSCPSHFMMVSQLKPLLYDAYYVYEQHHEPNQVRLNQMVELGLQSELLYYLGMCRNHIIPLSPPLMRCLYYAILRFRPQLELVIMWETVHIPGSHHNIHYSVASPRSPFAPTSREYIILARGHWFKWSIFNIAHISDNIHYTRPLASSASSRIGLGFPKARQLKTCGVSIKYCITPPSCNVVTTMPSKQLQPNSHQCTICAKFTHYHCGVWLTKPSRYSEDTDNFPGAPDSPWKGHPEPLFGVYHWWCCDCIDVYRDLWTFIPLLKEGIPPLGRASLDPAAAFLSTLRPSSYSVAFAATPLYLGSAVLAIARVLGMDSDDILLFLNPEGIYKEVAVSYNLPLAVALPALLAQSLELLRMALSDRMIDDQQRLLSISWTDLRPQVLHALQKADVAALASLGKETLALPAGDAYRVMTQQGLCPMNPDTLVMVVKAVGTACNLRLRMRHQLIKEHGSITWRLLIAHNSHGRSQRVGMIVLRHFKYYGYQSPMCCGDTEWHSPGVTDLAQRSIAVGAIGLGKLTTDSACGLRALASAVGDCYECLYNLYVLVLRSQLTNFNVNLQACLDVAHLAYCMRMEKALAAVQRFQEIQEYGIKATLTYMLEMANHHIVPMSPTLMRFMYEAYCEQVSPQCAAAICLIWKCDNNYVAWNYLHPPSPMAPHNKQFIILSDSHWEHLTQFEVSIKLPPNPSWFVPNIILYDELIGASVATDPLFWLIASEIGTGPNEKTEGPAHRGVPGPTLPDLPQPRPARCQGGHPTAASWKHTSGLACPLQALAEAFSEPFGLLLLVWMEFLVDLQYSPNQYIGDMLVSALATYHEDFSDCVTARDSFYKSLMAGPHAVSAHMANMAAHQIVPMSPPLMSAFYDYMLSSPTLNHHADKEVCLLWQDHDGSMARVILHPNHPFKDLPRAYIFLGYNHYALVPETELCIVLPDRPTWTSPNLLEFLDTIGLGCFNFRPTRKRQSPLELVSPAPRDAPPVTDTSAPPTSVGASGWLPGVARRIGNLLAVTPPSRGSRQETRNTYSTAQPSPVSPPVLLSEAQQLVPPSPSPYAVNNPAAADTMKSQVEAVVMKSPSILTTKVEATHWRYWCQYTTFLQTSSIRDNISANTGADSAAHQNEVAILRYAPIWIAQNCMEGRKKKQGTLGPISRPTPQSALQVISSVTRIHRRKGIEMAKVSWKEVLNGMCREYTQQYGVSALQPEHHETFTREEVDRLTSPPDGLIVTSSLTVGDNIKWRSFHGSMTTSSETGRRIADVAQNPGVPFTLDRLTRDSLSWIIGGQHYKEPGVSLLCSITLGDMAVLTSASSKNDQFGLQWAGAPSYLPYGSHSNCACRSLAAYEVIHPCSGNVRGQVPLFSTDEAHSPWSTHDMSNSLKCLQTQLGLAHKSWHSFRVYIASALLASGSDDATIQAMVRWKTQEACKIYSRIDPIQFGNNLLRASTAEVSSVQARNLPDIDLTRQLQALQVNHGPAGPLIGDGGSSRHATTNGETKIGPIKRPYNDKQILSIGHTAQPQTHAVGRPPRRSKVTTSPRVAKSTAPATGHIRGDVWEVESVIKSRRTNHGTKEFLIKWKGWPPSANTWEPASNLLK